MSQSGNGIVTGTIAGFLAFIPPGVLGYVEKMFSAILLAMAAEAGRRFFSWIAAKWSKKQ